MSGDVYNAGYRSITNIDYSSVCIDTMRARYSQCPSMTWHQMDIRQLSFPNASFDVILEKATLDAILVEEKSQWQISPQIAGVIHQTLTEVLYWFICESTRSINIIFIDIWRLKISNSAHLCVSITFCSPKKYLAEMQHSYQSTGHPLGVIIFRLLRKHTLKHLDNDTDPQTTESTTPLISETTRLFRLNVSACSSH